MTLAAGVAEVILPVDLDTGAGREAHVDRTGYSKGGVFIEPDLGRAGVAYFYFDGVAVDAETLTLNGRVYQFLMTATPLTGDVRVSIQADQTADAAITALVAAIVADASATFDAIVMVGAADTSGGMLLVEKTVGGVTLALSDTCTNGELSAAAPTNFAGRDLQNIICGEYLVTAQDVTTLALTGGNEIVLAGIASTTEPKLVGFVVRTSAGATVIFAATLIFTISQVNTNYWVLICEDGAADLTSADVIGYTLAING